MEFDLENEIYSEILVAYEERRFHTGFEEKEIIKLMNLSKLNVERTLELGDVISNALILLLVLFFNKSSHVSSQNMTYSKEQLHSMKLGLLRSLNGKLEPKLNHLW